MTSTRNKLIRVALVGAGAISHTHAEALRRSDAVQLVAVVDINIDAARKLASPDDCVCFTTLDQLLNEVECDAAIVCTPPNTHPAICQQLFSHGIHVLCEKPVALDSVSAKQMVNAAKAAGVQFTMASKFRYVDDMMRAKSMLDAGLIGELLVFENYFTSPVDMSRRWNSDPNISGGGVLIDNGTHSVDIAHYLLGPLKEVQAVEGKRYQALDIEDTVSVIVRSQANIAGRIDLSWSISLERRGYVNLIGSEGVIVVGWQTSTYKLNSGNQWVRFGNGYDKFHAFSNQLENFVGAIRNEEPLLITSDDALASVEVIEVAYQALNSKSWCQVSYNPHGRLHADSGYSALAFTH